jgi:hypothetical protein
MNSVVGLLTMAVNVTTARDNHWSKPAKISIVIISIFTGNMSVLYFVYTWLVEKKIKTAKDKEIAKCT